MTSNFAANHPAWSHEPAWGDLVAWRQAWRASTGRQPLVLVSHGRPEYGLAPVDSGVWTFLAEQIRHRPTDGEGCDFVLRVRGGNLAYLRDLLEVIAQRGGRRIERSVVLDWATSAGTLLALGCGQVAMGSTSYLSSIAPQIARTPDMNPRAASDIARLIEDNAWLAPRPMDEILGMGAALQWQAEVERWLHGFASTFGWEDCELDSIVESLLDPTVPHDAHLFRSAISSASSILQPTTETEDQLLDRLRVVLDVERWEASEGGLLLHTVVIGDGVFRCRMAAANVTLPPDS